MARDNTEKYLPLTESTYYVMLSLTSALHGYGVMLKVEDISQGTVKLGPGTLYGILTTLEKEGLIVKVGEADRRKSYTLTGKGRKVLASQIKRLEIMTRNGLNIRKYL
jgi:DNA-binding PadR family transcriptional regulator